MTKKNRLRAQIVAERAYQSEHNRRVKANDKPLYCIAPEPTSDAVELAMGIGTILSLPVIFGMATILLGG